MLQRKCQCDDHTAAEDKCDACSEQHSPIQRSCTSQRDIDAIPPIVEETLSRPGQPLGAATQSFFERRFGRDFSSVRIHTDPAAAASARAVDADAYTVSRHIVVGTNGFDAENAAGRALLAHELTHVMQQESGVAAHAGRTTIDPDPGLEAHAQLAARDISVQQPGAHAAVGSSPTALQRQPKGSGKSKPAPHITQVNVDQQAQRVKATFSDGTTLGDHCSTGKGHCCFDAASGMAEGGACSPANSAEVGNNCTPVGSWTVTKKYAHNSALPDWWTQFHDAKSVALHQYSPVDGTPLSHGCVRLDEDTAHTIFDGAREGVTKVVVTGTAQPRCDHANLQKEWEKDFRDAGAKPPDGERAKLYTKAELENLRKHTAETRKELRSALGVNDTQLDAEIADVKGGTSVVSKIPRCVPSLTTAEQKVPAAQKAGVVAESTTADAAKFSKTLARAATAAAAEKAVRAAGSELGQKATAAAKGGTTDDKQLRWARLMLSTAIRQWKPAFTIDTDSERRLRAKLLELLEQTSRGQTAAVPPAKPDTKRQQ
ncbi:hypothetical protein A5784_21035 [Mycobacterium sp. 852013-50091_SCH5140682]|nr:hypothetical protein A5784_21035 [Mycobacterium sp. 852013-50091_SCH5140682]